jgi:hypothetical protein
MIELSKILGWLMFIEKTTFNTLNKYKLLLYYIFIWRGIDITHANRLSDIFLYNIFKYRVFQIIISVIDNLAEYIVICVI